MLWNRLSYKSNVKTCFYCNVQADLGSVRTKDWLCPHCEALNITGSNGEILDDVPARYQDISANDPSPAVQIELAPLSSPFCSICASNQALLVKNLAAYLPDEGHSDADIYQRALPAYRAALEERFPILCNACAPSVQARLQRNNYLAKSTVLGNWLKRSEGLPLSRTNTPANFAKTITWLLQGAVWLAISGSMIIWSLKSGLQISSFGNTAVGHHFALYLTPQSMLATLDIQHIIRFLLPLSLLSIFWHPHGMRLIYDPNLLVRNRQRYRWLQVAIVLYRLFVFYFLPWLQLDLFTMNTIHAISVLIHVLHLLLSFRMLDFAQTEFLSMTDRSTALQDYVSQRPNASDPQEKVVLTDTDSVHGHQTMVANDEDDAMDWQTSLNDQHESPFSKIGHTSGDQRPSPFRTSINRNGNPISLSKQTFFAPEVPTGLESLFSSAVTLEDEPLIVRSLKSVKRQSEFTASSFALLLDVINFLTLSYSIELAIVLSTATALYRLFLSHRHEIEVIQITFGLIALCLRAIPEARIQTISLTIAPHLGVIQQALSIATIGRSILALRSLATKNRPSPKTKRAKTRS